MFLQFIDATTKISGVEKYLLNQKLNSQIHKIGSVIEDYWNT